MGIRIHADDFGLTSGINQSILEAHQNGVLHAVSIIPNGYAFDEAINIYHQHSFDIHVHLNFIEGKPLHVDTQSSFLVDSENDFSLSFITLLRKTMLVKGREREEWKSIIKNEMKSQILKVKSQLKPNALLCVDSHQHVHMIPLFWEALSELIHELDIKYIRIPGEKISFNSLNAGSFISSGWIKVLLLRQLSSMARVKLPDKFYTRDFIGVLHTGKMNLSLIKNSIKLIQNSSSDIEILLHPGKAAAGEEQYWEKYPSLIKYYFSEKRTLEKNVLLSDEMKSWIVQLKNRK